ncbi:MAG: hypothetical protein AAFW97_00975, partial [Pseudomonadota bacterium]
MTILPDDKLSQSSTDTALENDAVRERWGAFAWTEENAAEAEKIVARYPQGRQASAVMPLLDLAQRQIGAETKTQGWLPVPVIEFVSAPIWRWARSSSGITADACRPWG